MILFQVVGKYTINQTNPSFKIPFSHFLSPRPFRLGKKRIKKGGSSLNYLLPEFLFPLRRSCSSTILLNTRLFFLHTLSV
jgi:hypothetical protein